MIKMNSMDVSADVTKSERYLHTPSSFAKQNLHYVQEVGKLQSLIPHKCIREKLDSFLIILVLEGRGCLTVKDKEYTLKSGDCAFVDCNEHYEHISDEKDAWKLAWVHFNGSTVRSFYELFMKHNDFCNVFHTECAENIVTVIDQLMEMKDNRDIMSELRSNELLLSLLRKVIGSVANTEIMLDDTDKVLLNEAREYLNENYAKEDILDLFAKELGQSVETFEGKFRAHYGIGIEEYVNNRRFLAAKEMLRFSIKSIPEIATESGIRDVLEMQKLFDEKENMTVEEYRSKWAQWIK